MYEGLHIAGAQLVNEGKIIEADVLIEGEKIKKIEKVSLKTPSNYKRIEANQKYLLPGVIDTHVHFREPGLTWKGSMTTESKAALAGGVTSVIEMPNTVPPTVDYKTLENKYELARSQMLVNFGFYVAATLENLQELHALMLPYVAGVKLFYGSTTGNILFNDPDGLEKLFSLHLPLIVAHAEDERIIRQNTELFRKQIGDDHLQAYHHSLIRSRESCLAATSHLVYLASQFKTRLHLLHISTADEVSFLKLNKSPYVTSETCIHYLWFSDKDYQKLGNFIKCNPSIKTTDDRDALRDALKDGVINTLSTDHAPHTCDEKMTSYLRSPSGIPSIQYGLPVMLTLVHEGNFHLIDVVKWMSHQPSEIFRIAERGFIREGYYADLILVDMDSRWKVWPDEILYRCGWSPWVGVELHGKVIATILNGKLVYENGKFLGIKAAKPLEFIRPFE